MAKTDSPPLVVLQSFVGKVDGADIQFRQGESIEPSHPAVKKWPHFFGPSNVRHDHVEQATAAPGEKRG